MLTRALVLLLLTATACLPVWMLPELDGTEGRRVQIAVEMVERGDWLVPTLGHEPTWAKPPLHYWLLATILRWFGDHPMLLRLPSVLGAWFAAWLAGELLRRWFGPVEGWIGALGIVCAPLVVFSWSTAEIDPLFASLVAASLWALATGVARLAAASISLVTSGSPRGFGSERPRRGPSSAAVGSSGRCPSDKRKR